jgi:hypothetical protein
MSAASFCSDIEYKLADARSGRALETRQRNRLATGPRPDADYWASVVESGWRPTDRPRMTLAVITPNFAMPK